MTNIATTTNTTCSTACWMAREDDCHCSCGGANHGCLRTAGGERPERMSQTKGTRYVLKAIGGYSEIHQQMYKIERAAYATWYDTGRRIGSATWTTAAFAKHATKDQAAKWDEIRPLLIAERPHYRPYLLWVREDLAAE